jgi:hypothetical protein
VPVCRPPSIGVVGQEAAEVVPYAIEWFTARLDPDAHSESELLASNPHAPQFVLVTLSRSLDALLQGLAAEREGGDDAGPLE